MSWARTSLCLIVAATVWLGCTEVNVPSDEAVDGISVSGTGKATASPDIARAQIGVQTFHEDVGQAVADNNDAAGAIIAALRREGLGDRDIRTATFSISERRDYRLEQPDQVVGYQVNNTVAVTIRDVERVGDVLQQAIDAGANNVFGVQFSIDDPSPMKKEAREKAIEDAHDRAQTIADAADVTLGPAIRIVETGPGVVAPRQSYDEASAGAGVPAEPGELEVTVTVSVVYEIL